MSSKRVNHLLTDATVTPWSSIGPRNELANEKLDDKLTIQTYPVLHPGYPNPHLTPVSPGRQTQTPRNKPREHYCAECHARVTISSDNTGEYGHLRTDVGPDEGPCPHHIYDGKSSKGDSL